MPPARRNAPSPSPAVEAYLLGRIALDDCLALQERLAAAIGQRDDGQICLLLCEHPPVVTVGRGGSPAELRRDAGLLRTGQVPSNGSSGVVAAWFTARDNWPPTPSSRWPGTASPSASTSNASRAAC